MTVFVFVSPSCSASCHGEGGVPGQSGGVSDTTGEQDAS